MTRYKLVGNQRIPFTAEEEKARRKIAETQRRAKEVRNIKIENARIQKEKMEEELKKLQDEKEKIESEIESINNVNKDIEELNSLLSSSQQSTVNANFGDAAQVEYANNKNIGNKPS